MDKQDANECRLTGAIDRTRKIPTKTGAPMAEVLLKVRQDRFRVVCHGNVAEHLLVAAGPGDRLSITGTLTVSSWKDESTGEWRNSFSVTAWCAEIHGNQVAYQRKKKTAPAGGKKARRWEPPMAQEGDFF